ncbi:MAG: aldehyde dehydrogenase family protein [Solirubrobacterales bacterium]|nr:aldehyde dehydrogenase family protein [Solirubrobacterales bacterium]
MGYETRLLVGGESITGEGPAIEVENPATGEIVATVAAASAAQLDDAVKAADAARADWAGMAAVDRAPLLHEVAARLRERSAELARLMTVEIGRPLTESADEVEWCAACFDYYAEVARSEIGRVIPPIESTQFAVVVKEPHGVVGAIVPWNFPLLLLTWKLAPALAAGNTVVAKPSELTPLSTLAIADVFSELPPGTVNLVAGDGQIGAGIAEHPGVDCVAFTGSVATGRRVGVACAARNARVNLEMGGKDPFIVCDDLTDEQIAVAARGGAWAAFLNAGQVCTSSERFYVMAGVFDRYVEAFLKYTEALRVGDPFDPETEIGSMASAGQKAKALAQVDAAVAAGAELLTGGGDAGRPDGHFLEPCVLTGVPADADLLREETFGPVAPLVPVGSLDEAIERANGLDFGLGANIYTADLKTAIRCVKEVRAGSVWINDPLTDNDAGPFGGFKNSGIGRELGTEGLDAFREAKHAHIETEIADKEWWYPYG